MLDLKYVCDNIESVKKALSTRSGKFPIDEVALLALKRKELKNDTQIPPLPPYYPAVRLGPGDRAPHPQHLPVEEKASAGAGTHPGCRANRPVRRIGVLPGADAVGRSGHGYTVL